jgi:hypothetical protein
MPQVVFTKRFFAISAISSLCKQRKQKKAGCWDRCLLTTIRVLKFFQDLCQAQTLISGENKGQNVHC